MEMELGEEGGNKPREGVEVVALGTREGVEGVAMQESEGAALSREEVDGAVL